MTLKTEGHPGKDGPTLQDKIRKQMDHQADKHDELAQRVLNGDSEAIVKAAVTKGRFEGMAAALAILRSSNLADEIRFSQERRESRNSLAKSA